MDWFQLKSSEESSADGVESGGTPPANGSIFTMTLKNNHLIVETEERNVRYQSFWYLRSSKWFNMSQIWP